jgi:hypothetical protein
MFIGILALSILIGFGFWYLIGFFLADEANPLKWSIFGKVVYLFASFITTGNGIEEFSKTWL